MIRIFFFLVGFGLAVIGGISFIAFLNLLTTGFSPGSFFSFINQRAETYLLIIGLLIIAVSISFPKK